MGSGQNFPHSTYLPQTAEGSLPKPLCTNPRINDLEGGGGLGATLVEGISKPIYLIQGFYPHPEVLLWQISDSNLIISAIEYRR